MTTKNTCKTLQNKTQNLKRSIVSFALFHPLIKNKRAVSAVISNIILIGAVIAVGLVALGYARSTAINYQEDYSETMNNDINKIKEALTFEYAHYSANQLSLYIMNSGPINVTIKSISINSSPVSSSTWSIYPINGAQAVSNNLPIAKGTEVRIVVSTTEISLLSGENSVKITSGSDSNFAYNFLV